MISSPILLSLMLISFATIFYIIKQTQQAHFSKKIIEHPVTYSLSLGAYSGAWVILGATQVASNQGYSFLAYYFGTSILFIFSPILLQPLASIARSQRLSSLADLFSYRYNSKWAGAIVAIGLLFMVMPLLGWQISIVNSAALLLSDNAPNSFLAKHISALVLALFCVFIAIKLSSKQHTFNDRYNGLVIISAFLALLKLLLFLALGLSALYGIFGSNEALELWLSAQPEKLQRLSDSLSSNNARTLMLIFFVASLVMPHSYHLIFTENRRPQNLATASWLFPLYLLLLSLPVLPITWALESLSDAHASHLYTLLLGNALHSTFIAICVWLAILAAAIGAIIAILLAMASLCTNHLILPFSQHLHKNNTLAWLDFIRYSIIFLLMATAFLLHFLFSSSTLFEYIYYASYIAVFQFIPGILAVLYWPRGNHQGVIAGLLAGLCLWAVSALLPFIAPTFFYSLSHNTLDALDLNNDYWVITAVASLGINMLVFAIVSYLKPLSEEERNAAQICAQDKLNIPNHYQLAFKSIKAFEDNLSKAIGQEVASREIRHALKTLGMQPEEKRPFALRLLRRQIEVNISGLFGPTVARQIVNEYLPYIKDNHPSATHDIQLLEYRLEQSPLNVSGIALELDKLRRYHRETLEQLPLGICTINRNGEILMWNYAMQGLSHIQTDEIIGSQLKRLAEPWQTLLQQFIQSEESALYNQLIEINHNKHWVSLHKAHSLENSPSQSKYTILVEDTSTRVQLEQEILHNERLASIGRLAAGIAHEIGNPVTAIACLAQNLKYDSDSPEVDQSAKEIITQTQRITRIVQSLVNFSHTGSHGQEIHWATVDLYQCADDAIHLLSFDKQSYAHLIQNNIQTHCYILGDHQLLLQMFLNLLKNALDAIDKNQGLVTLSSQCNEQYNTIFIEDNGHGISPTLQAQIFEPFFTTKETGQGTGLGLALVYGIIEDHQGRIHLQSPINDSEQGTRFTVQFPSISK